MYLFNLISFFLNQTTVSNWPVSHDNLSASVSRVRGVEVGATMLSLTSIWLGLSKLCLINMYNTLSNTNEHYCKPYSLNYTFLKHKCSIELIQNIYSKIRQKYKGKTENPHHRILKYVLLSGCWNRQTKVVNKRYGKFHQHGWQTWLNGHTPQNYRYIFTLIKHGVFYKNVTNITS